MAYVHADCMLILNNAHQRPKGLLRKASLRLKQIYIRLESKEGHVGDQYTRVVYL